MGKAPPTPTSSGYEYYQTIAVVPCRGNIKRVRRIWFDNDVVYDDRPEQAGWSGRPITADGRRPALASYLVLDNIEVYPGSQTQDASPTLEAAIGVDDCPAYRGRCLVVFKDLPIHKFGGRMPGISFEIEGEGADANGKADLADIVNAIMDMAGDTTQGIPGVPAANRDLSALAGIKVDGFVVGQRAEARQHLASLQDAFMFDFADIDYKVTAVLRGGDVVATIEEAHLGCGTPDPQHDLLDLKRGQQLEVPQRVDVVYQSQAIDFQTFTQSTSREATQVLQPEELNLPVVMTESAAMAIARRHLAMRQLQRDTVRICVPWRYMLLAPTDIVEMPMPSGIVQRFKIVKQLLGLFGHIELAMVPDDPDIYTLTGDGAAAPGGGGGGVAESYAPVIYAVDTNALTPAADASFDGCNIITVVATARKGWPGANVQSAGGIQDVNGINQHLITQHTKRGTIARLTATMGKWRGANVWDTTNTITLQLEQVYTANGEPSGTNTGNGIIEMNDPSTGSGVMVGTYTILMLSATSFRVYDPVAVTVGLGTVGVPFTTEILFTITAGSTPFVNGDEFDVTVASVGAVLGDPPQGSTDLAVLNGANALIVGGEVVQFVSATDLGNDTYQLSRLLRGRRGTEHLAWDDHAAGTVVAFLDTEGIEAQRFKAHLAESGNNKTLNAFDVGKAGLDYTNTPSTTITLAGNVRKPWSPGGLQVTREADGDILFEWVHRSRWGDEWNNGGDGSVPLGEATEEYHIEIWTPDFVTMLRSVTGLTDPEWTYTSADQVTDGLDSPADFGVKLWQTSPLVGDGHVRREVYTGV